MPDPVDPPANPPANPPASDPRDVKIAELETKLEDMGTELGNVTQGLTSLTKVIQEALSAPNPPANPPADPANPPTNPPTPPTQPRQDPTVASLDVKSRSDIVTKIEQRFGYDKLPEADRKKLRSSVEARLNGYGTSVFTAPVHQLESLLNDAYLLSDLPKAKEQGRLEGIVDAHVNDIAALPTMSTTPTNTESTQLSTEQQELAQKWNLDQSKVAGHLKELQEKGVITYKPKEQRAAESQATPSGTPTPPAPAS